MIIKKSFLLFAAGILTSYFLFNVRIQEIECPGISRSVFEFAKGPVSFSVIDEKLSSLKMGNFSLQSRENRVEITANGMSEDSHQRYVKALEELGMQEVNFDGIGPTKTRKALLGRANCI